MITPVTHANYRELIQRFLDGDTSIAEEKSLYAYFSRADLPEEAMKYREMFQWYASLPALGKASAETPLPAEASAKGQSMRPRWIAVAASAAILVVGLLATLLHHSPQSHGVSESLLSHTSGYIIRDGVRITDPSVVLPAIEIMEREFDTSAASVMDDLDRLSAEDQVVAAFGDDPEIASMLQASLQY